MRTLYEARGAAESLNSLFGISFVVTIRIKIYVSFATTPDSQFPFWDFFCCNPIVKDDPEFLETVDRWLPLNSLFGISFVVTFPRRQKRSTYGSKLTLNSLFGISFVVTSEYMIYRHRGIADVVAPLNSLFGISFVVTRRGFPVRVPPIPPKISIPFLGFLLL
jgi:hypothetical protein